MRRALLLVPLVVCLKTPVLADPAPLFPDHFCATLPALSADEQAKLWDKLPDLKGAPAKLVSADTALALMGRAVDNKLATLEVFTQDAIREDCAYVITGDVVDRLSSAYDLFLLTPFSGTDTQGKPFKTVLFIFGRGHLYQFYDRGGFSYKHPVFKDTFTYDAVIKETTPTFGDLGLAGVRGPFGLSIEKMKFLPPDHVEVHAGPFSVTRELHKIARKTTELAPVSTVRLPTPARMQAWFEGR